MNINADIDDLRDRATEVAGLLKVLSHPNRLLIACELANGETTVTGLSDAIGAPQPLLSRDLGRMRADGLVATRRDSRFVYYKLADDRLARVIIALCDAFGPNADAKPARIPGETP